MKRKKRNMTSVQLKEYFNNYHIYLARARENQENQLASAASPTAGTAQYGVEATMPKAQGNRSDPTYNAVVGCMANDSFINSRMLIVEAIGKWARHIKGHEQTEVLRYWLEGLTLVETGEKMGVKKTKVGKVRDQVVKSIMEGEGFEDESESDE